MVRSLSESGFGFGWVLVYVQVLLSVRSWSGSASGLGQVLVSVRSWSLVRYCPWDCSWSHLDFVVKFALFRSEVLRPSGVEVALPLSEQTANHLSSLDTPTNSHQTGRQTLLCLMGELHVTSQQTFLSSEN